MKKILFAIIAAGILAMSACAAKKGEETAGQQKETSIRRGWCTPYCECRV